MFRTKYNIGYTEYDLSTYQTVDEFIADAIDNNVKWYEKANKSRSEKGIEPLKPYKDEHKHLKSHCKTIWNDYKQEPPIPEECERPGSCWCPQCDPQSYG